MKSKHINPVKTCSVFLLEMDNALLNHVAEMINANCYWLRVADLSFYQQHCIERSNRVEYVTERCMTLEVKRSCGHHYKGHRWHIPIIHLDEVLSEMKTKDATLRERCRNRTLTKKDIDNLFLGATYNVVNLKLSDDLFDYHPRTDRSRQEPTI